MPRQHPYIPWNIIALFTLLFLGFLTAGVIFYTIEKGNIKNDKYDDLHAISSLKVTQIHNWYMERRGDASIIMRNQNFGYLFNRWLADRNDAYFPIVFNDLASSFKQYYAYNDVIMAGASGEVFFSINLDHKFVSPDTKSFIDRAITNNEIIFSDFYQCSTCRQIHIDIMAPIKGNTGGKSVTTGVIILRIDPYHDVYKMIQSWPTPSKTAETLLVRLEGNEVVFLNKLRHRKNTALQLRYPLTIKSLPAVMAAEGKVGIIEGIDYRNVPVLADVRHIPDMPWYIVAKVDIDEIYAPIRSLLAGVIMVTALLIAFAAGGLSWWWNKQRLNFYKLKYQAEESLRKSQERYRIISENTGDVIWIFNLATGTFTYVSPSVFRLRGYTPEEAMEQPIQDALTPEHYTLLTEGFPERIAAFTAGDPSANTRTYEVDQPHKNGSIVHTEVVTTVLANESGKPVEILGVSRDITERKRDEEKIRTLLSEKELLLKEVHHRIKNNMSMIASLLGLQASQLSEPGAVEALENSRSRVMSMASMYDLLYKTTDFRHISVNEYLGQVVDGITASLPAIAGVTVEKRIDDFVMDSRILFPVGIIINELVTNAYKYAFPGGGRGTIAISVSRLPEKNRVEITVSDNGAGIPENIDIHAQSGFGMKLVTLLVQQIEGTLECVRGGGTLFRINFTYTGNKGISVPRQAEL